MKISLEKEYDGHYWIASCTNVPGCYVQSENPDFIVEKLKSALEVYLKNCVQRNQPFPNERDRPVLDIRLRFDRISSDQLIKIFKRFNYHLDYQDEQSVLVLNSEFPFNRVHFPRSNNLSPLIIRRIFGQKNTIYVGAQHLKLNTSAS